MHGFRNSYDFKNKQNICIYWYVRQTNIYIVWTDISLTRYHDSHDYHDVYTHIREKSWYFLTISHDLKYIYSMYKKLSRVVSSDDFCLFCIKEACFAISDVILRNQQKKGLQNSLYSSIVHKHGLVYAIYIWDREKISRFLTNIGIYIYRDNRENRDIVI